MVAVMSLMDSWYLLGVELSFFLSGAVNVHISHLGPTYAQQEVGV